jgi:hypothetical protein
MRVFLLASITAVQPNDPSWGGRSYTATPAATPARLHPPSHAAAGDVQEKQHPASVPLFGLCSSFSPFLIFPIYSQTCPAASCPRARPQCPLPPSTPSSRQPAPEFALSLSLCNGVRLRARRRPGLSACPQAARRVDCPVGFEVGHPQSLPALNLGLCFLAFPAARPSLPRPC